ncbi:cupin-like domain-containing protein [Novosphingobium sp.]|uniref:cupin-like domain-containing protein n=1 Tax=Novosphingobium sp. TaxID=1874826 RepID=UPI0025F8A739|nr:cupin-like domain-containing protein [Novosphingobium sp.]MCC6925220.1 cupin-like domain-containing protein [Novosphingobium sp.]
MKALPSRSDVTPEIFAAEIRPAGQPVIMKGLVGEWPIVRAARSGDEALVAAISANATPEPVMFAALPPEAGGLFHYTEDASQLNFTRHEAPLAQFLHFLQTENRLPQPRTLAAQGVQAGRFVPGFDHAHPLPLVPRGTTARLWIGNRACVATQGDDLENVACVVAGRRRFTLFPPEQLANLYLGPFELTPGGTPISMVHLTRPDLNRYPRFATALEAAVYADLEPGDALYVPYQWYHHVQAFETINVLVNYWWSPAREDLASPWDAMLLGMLALRELPADQRQAWRALFDHYVFKTEGDPGAHLPEAVRGVLGELTSRQIAELLADLRANLDPASTQKRGPLK